MDQIVKNCLTQDRLFSLAGSSLDVVNYIYGNTLVGSPLRKVIVENFMHGRDWMNKKFPEEETSAPRPQGFHLELIQRLGELFTAGQKGYKGKDVFAQAPCNFHKHPTEEHRVACASKPLLSCDEYNEYLETYNTRRKEHQK